MFKNLIITAKMSSAICAVEPICLDALVSAAKAMELVKEEFYNGKNIYGKKEIVDETLSKIFDKKYDVFCTSFGFGENREFIGAWTKRWDTKRDILTKEGRGKHRVDTGAGYYKNYYDQIVLRSYKEIHFYARGDKDEIERLLKYNIHSIGKKRTQGYGRVRKWIVEEIENDFSVIKGTRLMRHIPQKYAEEYFTLCTEEQVPINIIFVKKPIIPPYWRNDNLVDCISPY